MNRFDANNWYQQIMGGLTNPGRIPDYSPVQGPTPAFPAPTLAASSVLSGATPGSPNLANSLAAYSPAGGGGIPGTVGAPNVSATAAAASTLTPDQLRWEQLLEKNKPDPALGWAQAGIQGIGMLGSLGLGAYGLYQGKQAFDFQKNMAERNYQNSVTDYNTNRADRVMGRYSSEERVQNKDAIEKEIRDSQLPTSRR